jgi:3'-phosphoadenosine 5'-phosphosulfate sulfotransferase (PAPS reductase)/FAD synthetase
MTTKMEAAWAAIDAVFVDTSVEPGQTLSRLEELKEEVEVRIDAIKADLRHR